jgi:hypothetical protein
MKTTTQTLAAALRKLVNDGVANAAILEAAERLDELMAQVAVLRIAALNAVQTMSGGKVKADLRDAYDATPEQCLREIQAKAVIAAANACNKYSGDFCAHHDLMKYANRIRQGGE